MDQIQSELLGDLKEPEFRHTYANEFIDMTLARQIRALRKQRNWTQQQLADRIEKKQSFISALEDEDYGSMTVSTLKEIAEAFDVFLSVRFESFRTLIDQVAKSRMRDLEVSSFDEDPFFSVIRDEHVVEGSKNFAFFPQRVGSSILFGSLVGEDVDNLLDRLVPSEAA